jgi:hypothetical protein
MAPASPNACPIGYAILEGHFIVSDTAHCGSAFDFLERNYGIKALIGMNWIHISDHDLEKYYLGMVTAEEELAPLEEHILACSSCAGRAEATQAYVDTLRVALLTSSD